jgi:glycyl-tRNA synthetase
VEEESHFCGEIIALIHSYSIVVTLTLTMDISEDELYALKASITKQQSTVKQLKKEGGDPDLIGKEVANLLEMRARLAAIEKTMAPDYEFNRKSFDELILRKMFVVPAFEIHNGPAGLFDYGPACCGLKANIINLWRQHFIFTESMLEMETTCLTPSSVLQTSGHVERFTDFMVRDVITGECHRADKLLEDVIDKWLHTHPELSPLEVDEHRCIQVQYSVLYVLLCNHGAACYDATKHISYFRDDPNRAF